MTKLARQTETARKYRARWQQTGTGCRSFHKSTSLECLCILDAIEVIILLYLGHRDVYNKYIFPAQKQWFWWTETTCKHKGKIRFWWPEGERYKGLGWCCVAVVSTVSVRGKHESRRQGTIQNNWIWFKFHWNLCKYWVKGTWAMGYHRTKVQRYTTFHLSSSERCKHTSTTMVVMGTFY